MYVFDSGAKHEQNFRVKVRWLDGLPMVMGRYGCPETQHDLSSFDSAQSHGSMNKFLFIEYIEKVVLPLYPNIALTTKFDKNGKLLCGPVII